MALFLFSACSSEPVSVFVYAKSEVKPIIEQIIIDKTDTFKLELDTLTIKLKPGKHSIVFLNKPSQEFEVGEKGGMLNLVNQEFIAYEVLYGEEYSRMISENISKRSPKAILQIGDVIYMSPVMAKRISDKLLRRILPTISKSKNGNFVINDNELRITGEDTSVLKGDAEYDTNDKVLGYKKFGNNSLYINKFWDYGLGEELPETIKSKSGSIRNQVAVISKSTFMMAALLGEDIVTPIPISDIEQGLRDAEKLKEKVKEQKQNEKTQLKF
jgi:hypothetical protein